jgi:hypothetical protein
MPLSAEQQALVERMDRARADARINGREPSEYFLDKCGAEAGDCGEEDEAPDLRPPRSAWALIWSIFAGVFTADKQNRQ